MKNLKKILFVLIIILGLTGCSFGSEDKEETKEKEKKENPVEIADPLETDASLFDYVGSFKNNEFNYTLDAYVSANNNKLNFEFTIPGTSDASVDEDGTFHASMEGGRTISFDVDEFKDGVTKVDDEFLGLKGTIKKVDNGYEVDLTIGDASEMESLSGKYEAVETVGGLKGYFVDGDYKAFAITPLAGHVSVSYVTVKDGFYNSNDTYCDAKSATEIVCDDEDITITKTNKGIKVDTEDKKIKGEYKAKK